MSAAGHTSVKMPVLLGLVGLAVVVVLLGAFALAGTAILFGEDEEVAADAEQQLYEAVNDHRVEHGAGELAVDEGLAGVAHEHSRAMADAGVVDHELDGSTPTDRVRQNASVDCRTVGENVAQTWYERDVETGDGDVNHYDSPEELATGIATQFLASDTHREQLLDERWNRTGIGIVHTDADRVFVTQKFCP